MSTLQRAQFFLERLRNSPYDFAAYFLYLLYDVLEMGSALERVQATLIAHRVTADCRRDIINAPPWAGSWLEVIAQPAWRLGRDPRMQIEVISRPGMAGLARGLIEQPDYALIYPGLELVPTADPSVLQTTAGGRIVYRTLAERRVDIRPRLLVIDTPQTRADLAMPTARDASFARIEEACSYVSPIGSISVTTNRLGVDDFTGRKVREGRKHRQGRYTIWDFPVIAQTDTVYQLGDESLTVFRGELLDPTVWDRDQVDRLQRTRSPAVFAAYWLQAPLPDDE